MLGRVLLIAEFAEQLWQAQHDQRVPRLLLLVLMQPPALFFHANFECLELMREPSISRGHAWFPFCPKQNRSWRPGTHCFVMGSDCCFALCEQRFKILALEG